MAGGGIKGGTLYGETDEIGKKSVENITTVHDLHATILHLVGLDHEKLTYRFGGRDLSLTDVHGSVVRPICLAASDRQQASLPSQRERSVTGSAP